jgi:teichuronic acid biosynthesis glycosyltransferase TuaH
VIGVPGLEPLSWGGMVVIASGMSWDDAWMSEKHLAIALGRRAPVLFVDPPVSWLTPLRKPHLRSTLKDPRLRMVAPGVARLTPIASPGVSRPVLREAAYAATRAAIRRAVAELGGHVSALVVASLDPVLDACDADLKVVYGTDDWVSGAALMGLQTAWLERRLRKQLERADLVVAVSPTLATKWSAMARAVAVVPNGCDTAAFAMTDETPPAPDVRLPVPIAGFIGHMSARIDLDLLEAVAETGHSVLLVGPRQLTFDPRRLDRLIVRENVQWTGPRDFPDLASYMRHIKVGLTPYADTPFNRSSFPLKTMEYLAAGRAAVVTDLPAARMLPDDLIIRSSRPADFARVTADALQRPRDPELEERRKAYAEKHSWAVRAREFAEAIGL